MDAFNGIKSADIIVDSKDNQIQRSDCKDNQIQRSDCKDNQIQRSDCKDNKNQNNIYSRKYL